MVENLVSSLSGRIGKVKQELLILEQEYQNLLEEIGRLKKQANANIVQYNDQMESTSNTETTLYGKKNNTKIYDLFRNILVRENVVLQHHQFTDYITAEFASFIPIQILDNSGFVYRKLKKASELGIIAFESLPNYNQVIYGLPEWMDDNKLFKGEYLKYL